MSSGQGVTQIQDGIAFKVNAPVIASGTLPDRGTVLKIDASQVASGTLTATLPSAASMKGQMLILKRVDSSANTLTIAGNGSDLIDGQPTETVVGLASLTLISDGNAWIIAQQTLGGILPITVGPSGIGVQTSNLVPGSNMVVSGGTGVLVGLSASTISVNPNPIFASITVQNIGQGQVVFPNTSGILSGSPSLFWDNTNLLLKLQGSVAGNAILSTKLRGDAAGRIILKAGGNFSIGDGTGATSMTWDNTLFQLQISNYATGPRIFVGTIANGAADPEIYIGRNVDNTKSGFAHAFDDESNITRTGVIGYNSYNSGYTFSGTANYDHGSCFQNRATFASSGTVTYLAGLSSQWTVSSGTATSVYGAVFYDTLGAGTVTNQYAIYINALAKGGSNWGIYSADSGTQSFHAGNIGIGTATVPAVPLHLKAAGATFFRMEDSADAVSLQLQVGAGGGFVRTITNAQLNFDTNSTTRWIIQAGGELQPNGGNTYSIGDATNTIKSLFWGTQAVAPVGLVGTPSITFAGDLTTGIYQAGASLIDFTNGGTRTHSFGTSQYFLRSNSGQVALGTSQDVTYSRDSNGNAILTSTVRQIAFGTAANGTGATIGYMCIPSSAGAPTGVPSNIPSGQIPYQYDSTNNNLWAYNGGWKKANVGGTAVVFS